MVEGGVWLFGACVQWRRSGAIEVRGLVAVLQKCSERGRVMVLECWAFALFSLGLVSQADHVV